MKKPVKKKIGSTATSSTALNATALPNSSRAVACAKPRATSEQSTAPMRTPTSLFPKTHVPAAMSHATTGGWSR